MSVTQNKKPVLNTVIFIVILFFIVAIFFVSCKKKNTIPKNTLTKENEETNTQSYSVLELIGYRYIDSLYNNYDRVLNKYPDDKTIVNIPDDLRGIYINDNNETVLFFLTDRMIETNHGIPVFYIESYEYKNLHQFTADPISGVVLRGGGELDFYDVSGYLAHKFTCEIRRMDDSYDKIQVQINRQLIGADTNGRWQLENYGDPLINWEEFYKLPKKSW